MSVLVINMLTIENLKCIEVRPDPSISESEKNHFRRGAEVMRAAIINAIRTGATPKDGGED